MLLYSVILIFCVKKLRLKCHKVIHTFKEVTQFELRPSSVWFQSPAYFMVLGYDKT